MNKMDHLVQTRISAKVYEQLDRQAEQKGLHIASYLRQIILDAISPKDELPTKEQTKKDLMRLGTVLAEVAPCLIAGHLQDQHVVLEDQVAGSRYGIPRQRDDVKFAVCIRCKVLFEVSA